MSLSVDDDMDREVSGEEALRDRAEKLALERQALDRDQSAVLAAVAKERAVVRQEERIKRNRARFRELFRSWTRRGREVPVERLDSALREELRALCWTGVPVELRRPVWERIVGNRLGITRELFVLSRSRGRTLRCRGMAAEDALNASMSSPDVPKSATPPKKSNEEEEEDDIGSKSPTPPPPQMARSRSGRVLREEDSEVEEDELEENEEESAGVFVGFGTPLRKVEVVRDDDGESGSEQSVDKMGVMELVDKDADLLELKAGESLKLLRGDLPRTFPQLAFFRKGGPLRGALEAVLEAFGGYRPDIGYVQGLGHISCFWLLQEPEAYPAFAATANLLLTRPTLRDLFRCEGRATSARCRAFELELRRCAPVAARALFPKGEQDAAVRSEIFVIPWLVSCFTDGFDLDDAVRFWDVIVIETQIQGDGFLWKMVAGFVETINKMLPSEFADATERLHLLRHASTALHSDSPHAPSLFQSIADIVGAEFKTSLGLRHADSLADVLLEGVRKSAFNIPRFETEVSRIMFQSQ